MVKGATKLAVILRIKPWIPKGETAVVRYYIDFRDGSTTWVHPAIYQSWDLKEGMDVDIKQLKFENEFKWKTLYNNGSWEREKVRIKAVKKYIETKRSDISVEIIGFGADSTDAIFTHTKEHGSPDLSVQVQTDEVAKIEVSGSEKMRGSDYWIRPDKIEYIKNHPVENVWIILHYQDPAKMIFIKIDKTKKYKVTTINIRGIDEHYVVIKDTDTEVKDERVFLNELMKW